MTVLEEVGQRHIAASAGAISLLVMQGGEIRQRLLLGEARPGVPMAEDTILLWLSAGKPITATAVARLYERGQLALDDAVVRYLPEFGGGGKSAITIGHLLTHTAGLHRVLPAVWETSDWASTIDRICAAALPAGFTPGQDAAYDPSAAWFVLAEIIQRLTGEPFEKFTGREVFAPAEMPNAAFSYTDEQAEMLSARLAQYCSSAAGKAHVLNWNAPPTTQMPRPGASLRCTTGDMARFYQALLDGKLLRLDTLKLFTNPARGVRPDQTFGMPMDWGLGFMVAGDSRAPYSFGPGASATAFGHGGQQTSIAFADPQQKRVVIAAYTALPGERAHNRRMAELLNAAMATV